MGKIAQQVGHATTMEFIEQTMCQSVCVYLMLTEQLHFPHAIVGIL